MELRIADHGQVIFQTYPVREPPQRKTGADEIMVLPGAIVSCGIVIDMVVASVLMSMGMMMLPPTTISMPFKILLFVLADGWALIIGQLVRTFY